MKPCWFTNTLTQRTLRCICNASSLEMSVSLEATAETPSSCQSTVPTVHWASICLKAWHSRGYEAHDWKRISNQLGSSRAGSMNDKCSLVCTSTLHVPLNKIRKHTSQQWKVHLLKCTWVVFQLYANLWVYLYCTLQYWSENYSYKICCRLKSYILNQWCLENVCV